MSGMTAIALTSNSGLIRYEPVEPAKPSPPARQGNLIQFILNVDDLSSFTLQWILLLSLIGSVAAWVKASCLRRP